MLDVDCLWVIKEKRNGLYIPVLERHNTFTDFGLSALAAAPCGYLPPVYLCLDGFFGSFQAQANPGDTTITVSAQVDLSGDTQLVLGVGGANQEVVSFTSGYANGNTYVYTLASGVLYTHPVADWVVRNPQHTDTLAAIQKEFQYDPTNAPNQRLPFSSAFSSGVGQNTMQYYFQSSQVAGYLMGAGLCDTNTVGTGNLHDHVTLGYYHNTSLANDIEVDVTIILTNA